MTFPWLVADVGGTNARFSLVTAQDDSGFQFEHTRTLPTVAYPRFEDCLQAYLAQLPAGISDAVSAGCIAMAGPVVGDQVSFTNLDWHFSRAALQQQLGWNQLCLLNDFAALACSMPHLGDADMQQLLPGTIVPQATKAIVGPGTGLGVAALTYTPVGWWPVPGEGGFTAYAPQSPRELAVAALLQPRMYLYTEALVSGGGLVLTYNSLAEIDGLDERVSEAAEVVDLALQQQQPLALEALQMFCENLGTAAGSAALLYGAKGGIYLGGGIVPRIVEFLQQSGFEPRLRQRGRQTAFMADIPVFLITHPYPAFLGAAAWLQQQLATPG